MLQLLLTDKHMIKWLVKTTKQTYRNNIMH